MPNERLKRSLEGGEVAKEQVHIKERIWHLRHKWLQHNQQTPDTLYIGQEDFMDLRRECYPWEFTDHTGKELPYMGMNIFRVDCAHHLNVCRLFFP